MRDFTGVEGASGGLADNDTRWTPAVGNSIVQEIANVIRDEEGGAAELNPADDTQLLAAIVAVAERIAAAAGAGRRKAGSYVGGISAGTFVSIEFDEPFPSTDYAIAVTPYNATGSASRDNWIQWYGKSEGGFTVVCQGSVTGGDNTLNGFDWVVERFD